MIKTCPECGKTFETDNPRRVYCSKKCSDRVRARRYYRKHYDPEHNKELMKKKREKWKKEHRCIRCGAPLPSDWDKNLCPSCIDNLEAYK